MPRDPNSVATKTMNTATQVGLAAVNQSRQNEVEAKASNLINSILKSRNHIKVYRDHIETERKVLAEIGNDVITQDGVMGTEFPVELNANQVTILNVIKKLNDAKQEQVSLRSQKHINAINSYQDTIGNLNKQIAEWNKQLAELSVEVVTEAEIAGN
jgi:SMC interacting uncharacterized protein involved in chromosome segregation